MDAEFWHRRWQLNQLAFHEGQANGLLVALLPALALAPKSRIFVPLCGKTRDIGWLLSQGHAVVGAELSRLAVDDLFTDLGVAPKVSKLGSLLHYAAPDLDIYVSDIFQLSADALWPVEAVYDRAALVALPTGMRDDYARHLVQITGTAPQLLICFEYDPALMDGPPFSIPPAEVARLYTAQYQIASLATVSVKGLLKGICPAQETAWHLH